MIGFPVLVIAMSWMYRLLMFLTALLTGETAGLHNCLCKAIVELPRPAMTLYGCGVESDEAVALTAVWREVDGGAAG